MRKPIRRLTLPSLIVVAAAGGMVYARMAPSPSSVINACIAPSGDLRFSADGVCKANETPISWNVQGPVGPTGPQGPQGPTGADATAPSGAIISFGGSTPPVGWLLCDGSAVSRTTNAALFAAIGTTYGAGDGTTTFNVPDLRGRVVVGVGQGSGLTARNLGDTFGEEQHTLTIAEMPAHTHTDAGHTHNMMRGGVSGPLGLAISTPTAPSTFTLNAADILEIQPGAANIQNTGGGTSHNIMQPSLALNMIVRQ